MSFGFSIGDIIKICEVATRVYRNCRDCPGGYKTLTSEARNLTNILQDVADKIESNTVPESKMSQLSCAYESCVEVLQELDKILNHYNSLDTRTKRTFDRLRYDPEKTKALREKLTSSVVMLNSFYSSLIHDSQVHILEALARLEKDYRGGYREESIASVRRIVSGEAEDDDEEDEDAAWPQIIRDLEDVGISSRDAIDYRDFIIDWFVRAVNEGRLMEEHAPISPVPETSAESFSDLSRDLGDTLPVLPKRSFETPRFPTAIPSRKPVPPPSPRQQVPTQDASSRPSPVPVVVSAAPATSPSTQTMDSLSQSSSTSISRRNSGQATPTTVENKAATNSLQTPQQATGIPRSSSEQSTEANIAVGIPFAGTVPTVQLNSQTTSATQIPTPNIYQQAFNTPPLQQSSSHLGPNNGYSAEPVPFVGNAPALQTTTTGPLTAPQVPVAPLVAQSDSSRPVVPPPAYNQLDARLDDNLIWTAQRIVAAWNSRDFVTAEKQLENQLAAVERGSTISIHGQVCQPDRRLLRHLLGVCASYSGNFQKAKRLFEGAFNGIYCSGPNIDDGDIAATRWLGDVCLHLNEPHNAALAWSVCLDGLISKYGAARDITRRVYEELRFLDSRVQGLQMLANSFNRYNTDASDIFRNTHTVEKSSLITVTIDRIRQMSLMPGAANKRLPSAPLAEGRRIDERTYRPRADWKIAEGFLVQPLISLSSWPLPYDPTFSPSDAINLHRNMTAPMNVYIATSGFAYNDLPSVGFVHSKDLHYVTKRSIQWLVQAVENGLKEMGIEFKEQGTMLMCRLNQRRDGLVFFEGIAIKFKKLQLRSMYGLKISEVLLATRGVPAPTSSFLSTEIRRGTEGFQAMVKDFLETAEKEEQLKEMQARYGVLPPQIQSPSLPHLKQRDTYSYG